MYVTSINLPSDPQQKPRLSSIVRQTTKTAKMRHLLSIIMMSPIVHPLKTAIRCPYNSHHLWSSTWAMRVLRRVTPKVHQASRNGSTTRGTIFCCNIYMIFECSRTACSTTPQLRLPMPSQPHSVAIFANRLDPYSRRRSLSRGSLTLKRT